MNLLFTPRSVCLAGLAGLLALAGLAGCATAPVAAPGTSPQVASAEPPCADGDMQTGSMIQRRCKRAAMTQEERDAVSRDITLRGQPKPVIKP